MPAVRAIKAGRPDAHITIAAPEKIAAAWKLVPEVDEIIQPNRAARSSPRSRLIRRQPRFDAAILFPNSLRAALEVWLAGVPRRIGYPRPSSPVAAQPDYFGAFEARPHRASGLPLSSNRARTGWTRRASDARNVLAPGESKRRDRENRPLPGRRIRAGQAMASGALCRGCRGGFSSAAGPMDFVRHSRRCGKWRDHRSGGWRQLRQSYRQDHAARAHRRAGECALLLTNDTGTMHLATILGVPVVAVFGSTEPRLTGPLGSGHHVIRHQVECSPCFLRECPIDFRCMKAVTVEEVTDVGFRAARNVGNASRSQPALRLPRSEGHASACPTSFPGKASLKNPNKTDVRKHVPPNRRPYRDKFRCFRFRFRNDGFAC